MIQIDTTESPIGPLTFGERAGRLCLLYFGGQDEYVERALERWYPGEPRVRRNVEPLRAMLRACEAAVS